MALGKMLPKWRIHIFLFFLAHCQAVKSEMQVTTLEYCNNSDPLNLRNNVKETLDVGSVVGRFLIPCEVKDFTAEILNKGASSYFEIVLHKLNVTGLNSVHLYFATVDITLVKSLIGVIDVADASVTSKEILKHGTFVPSDSGNKGRLLIFSGNVEDENTQTPSFKKSTYSFDVPEGFPLGQSLSKAYQSIIACDHDYPGETNVNNQLQFSISGIADPDIISVNGKPTIVSGDFGCYDVDLVLLKPLRVKENPVNFDLVATDLGTTSKNSTAKININVKASYSDPTPRFSQLKYQVNINAKEIQKNGTIDISPPIYAVANLEDEYFDIIYTIEKGSSEIPNGIDLKIEDPLKNITELLVTDYDEGLAVEKIIIALLIKASLVKNDKSFTQVMLIITIAAKETTTITTTPVTQATFTIINLDTTTLTSTDDDSTISSSNEPISNPDTSNDTTTNPITSDEDSTNNISSSNEPTLYPDYTLPHTLSTTGRTAATTSTGPTKPDIECSYAQDPRFSFDVYNVTIVLKSFPAFICTVSAGPCATYSLKTNDDGSDDDFIIHETYGDIMYTDNSKPEGKEITLHVEARGLKKTDSIAFAVVRISFEDNVDDVKGSSPIIIALSVIIAIMIAAAIGLSIYTWYRKKKLSTAKSSNGSTETIVTENEIKSAENVQHLETDTAGSNVDLKNQIKYPETTEIWDEYENIRNSADVTPGIDIATTEANEELIDLNSLHSTSHSIASVHSDNPSVKSESSLPKLYPELPPDYDIPEIKMDPANDAYDGDFLTSNDNTYEDVDMNRNNDDFSMDAQDTVHEENNLFEPDEHFKGVDVTPIDLAQGPGLSQPFLEYLNDIKNDNKDDSELERENSIPRRRAVVCFNTTPEIIDIPSDSDEITAM